MSNENSIAVAEFLRKSIFDEFRIFVVSDEGKRAALIGIILFFFNRVPGKCKNIHPSKIRYLVKTQNRLENCLSRCKHDVKNVKLS